MARVELNDGVTLKGARRVMTMRGCSLGITRRHGRLYTFKKFKCVQPNSEKQLACRDMLKRANELAREDVAREGRRNYWTKRAGETGYKTALGCARAWYMSELKGRMTEKNSEDAAVADEEKRCVVIDRKVWKRVVTVRRKTLGKRTRESVVDGLWLSIYRCALAENQ